MAAAKIAQIWTVFITALVKCLAVLGFKATTEAAAPVAAPAPAPVAAPVAAPASIPALTALLPRQRSGDRSVPPTMKQRIRAEAHGASPSSRSLSGRFGDAALAGALPELAVGDGDLCPA
ncbi:DUF6344 domain-containing protein [Streptomyces sp. NBC_01537]|uniref:DUF6344 domain-containing protein n=1 Tax=Streptomyces sp. NBC_01537 TaxID=2903896 RepID=UPI003864093E